MGDKIFKFENVNDEHISDYPVLSEHLVNNISNTHTIQRQFIANEDGSVSIICVLRKGDTITINKDQNQITAYQRIENFNKSWVGRLIIFIRGYGV